jgi:hypothetical protein
VSFNRLALVGYKCEEVLPMTRMDYKCNN